VRNAALPDHLVVCKSESTIRQGDVKIADRLHG